MQIKQVEAVTLTGTRWQAHGSTLRGYATKKGAFYSCSWVYLTGKRQGYEATYKSLNTFGIDGLDDLVYDFDTQQFIELSSGKQYTDKDFESLAGTKEARATHAGGTTLKRAAIARTFLREQGAGRQRLLELISKLALQGLENTQGIQLNSFTRKTCFLHHNTFDVMR